MKPLPTALAVVSVALMATALALMTVGDLFVAGLCFLCASVLLYFREQRLRAEAAEDA